MTRWLYNSDGDPVAFISNDAVYTIRGDFIGKLYADNQIWNGDYVGEILMDDRLVYNTSRLFGTRELPYLPRLPGFTGEPEYRGPITVPLGYRDVDIH